MHIYLYEYTCLFICMLYTYVYMIHGYRHHAYINRDLCRPSAPPCPSRRRRRPMSDRPVVRPVVVRALSVLPFVALNYYLHNVAARVRDLHV